MNGTIFRTYVERSLAPTLCPGGIVFMDNLSSHKVDGVGQAIEARKGKLCYLPPCSPDLNPIEQLLAKLKPYRRRWQIECLFGDSKTRGLNMEDTRLTQPVKLNTLLVIITLAMAWAYA